MLSDITVNQIKGDIKAVDDQTKVKKKESIRCRNQENGIYTYAAYDMSVFFTTNFLWIHT